MIYRNMVDLKTCANTRCLEIYQDGCGRSGRSQRNLDLRFTEWDQIVMHAQVGQQAGCETRRTRNSPVQLAAI